MKVYVLYEDEEDNYAKAVFSSVAAIRSYLESRWKYVAESTYGFRCTHVDAPERYEWTIFEVKEYELDELND